MPYDSNAQLPRGVQSYLCPAAQELYRQAYNYAWENHRYTENRYDRHDSRQVTASRLAWETVKKHCSKDERGRWVLVTEAQAEYSER